jgi:FixJ family two-component response regulator
MQALLDSPRLPSTPEPTVFVVDDDAEVRTSLNQLLRSARLHAKTYSSAFEFLEDYEPSVPGCLVLDIRMPGMSGLELQARLSSKDIELPIIMITGYGEVPMVVQAMQTGAFDFIQKPYSPTELLRRIQAAVERDVDRRSGRIPALLVAARLASLTPREQEILDLLLEENTNEEIAESLSITSKAAKEQSDRILYKLQVESQEQLRQMMFPTDSAED